MGSSMPGHEEAKPLAVMLAGLGSLRQLALPCCSSTMYTVAASGPCSMTNTKASDARDLQGWVVWVAF